MDPRRWKPPSPCCHCHRRRRRCRPRFVYLVGVWLVVATTTARNCQDGHCGWWGVDALEASGKVILSAHNRKKTRRNQHQQRCCGGSSNVSSLHLGNPSPQVVSRVTRGGGGGDGVPLGRRRFGLFPLDELDQRLWKLAIPCIANFAIAPLVGAIDLYFVNRMSNALAVAGQAAANQVFFTGFLLVSFLPSITSTLVSKEYASENREGLQNAICQALALGSLLSLALMAIVWWRTSKVLRLVLKPDAPAMEYAKPYLLIRSLSFLPSTINLICFATFRGILDPLTPLNVSLISNIIHVVLDPVFIFGCNMGVSGAAMATLLSEVFSTLAFLFLLFRRELVTWTRLLRLPRGSQVAPLLRGGAALQIRSLAQNLTFLAVTRATQTIDPTGIAASAHALTVQAFQLGGVLFLAMSTVAQIVIPGELVVSRRSSSSSGSGGLLRAARRVSDRLLTWGFVLGCLLAVVQLALLPVLQKGTPLEEVRQAARIPSYIASGLQVINGVVFVGEGIMVGCSNFGQVAINSAISAAATLPSLRFLPPKYGLVGVWLSFIFFCSFRLVGVAIHQWRTGKISLYNLQKADANKSG